MNDNIEVRGWNLPRLSSKSGWNISWREWSFGILCSERKLISQSRHQKI
jgi:hypothetical protein